MSSFFKYYLGPAVLGGRVAWDPVWGEMHREAVYIDALIGSDVETANEIGQLQRRVAMQARQLEELSVAFAVVLRMLAEAKQLDLEILDRRVDAELELRRTPPEKPAGTCVLCGNPRRGDQLSDTAYGRACAPSCEATR